MLTDTKGSDKKAFRKKTAGEPDMTRVSDAVAEGFLGTEVHMHGSLYAADGLTLYMLYCSSFRVLTSL